MTTQNEDLEPLAAVPAFALRLAEKEIEELRAENDRLREAIRDAERAILDAATAAGTLRLHEALAPLWAALSGSSGGEG